jgi:hypothetical protein
MGYIRGRADKGTLDRWAKYSSDNSYHPTKSEKAGGSPKMQDSNVGRTLPAILAPTAGQSGLTQARRGTEMVKSPAHWEQPLPTKAARLKSKSSLNPARLGFRFRVTAIGLGQARKAGVGFSGNATAVLHRGPDNPAAGDYRNPPEHRYKLTDTGAGTGPARAEIQNRLAKQRSK